MSCSWTKAVGCPVEPGKVGLLTVFVFFVCMCCGATTWTVNDLVDAVDVNPGDGVCATSTGTCSLRAAVMEANAYPGDDTIIVSPGTHTLSITSGVGAAGGDLNITEDLVVVGFGSGSTIVDCSNVGKAFTVESVSVQVQATFRQLTITGGTSHGLSVTAGNLASVEQAQISGNSGSTGGGVYVAGGLTLDGATVSGNHATGNGGGVFVASSGSLTIIGGTRIVNNDSGNSGGGVYADGSVLVYSGTIASNTAGGSGGGICVTNVGNLGILGNPARPFFAFNRADYSGGGVYSWNDSATARMIRWADFRENVSGIEGGGLEGTGLHQLVGCAFRDNVAEGGGGGGARIDGNQVDSSELSGNRSTGAGSALLLGADTLVVNSTVHGNLSLGAAAISVGGGTWVTMSACTITGNQGGGVLNGGTFEAGRTVVYGNPGGDCQGSAIISDGYNIDGDGSCGLSSAGDMPATNPVLGPLGPHGGPTWTRPVLRGSPALDAVLSSTGLAIDQRGEARPADGDNDGLADDDVGAYELVIHPGDADGSGWYDAVDLAVEIELAADSQLVPDGDPDCTTDGFFVYIEDIPCTVGAIW